MELLLGLTLITMVQLNLVKAYTVPTGSMAPTIRGVHKEVTCPRCNSRFPINASWEAAFADRPGARLTGCVCANCQVPIDFDKDKVTPRPAGGDRLIVAATSLKSLQRGDIMVHRHPPAWFGEKRVTLNYVSRLMGLPGETLAISAGRLYVSSDLKFKDDKVERDELWRPDHMHIDDAEAIKRFEQGKFQIVRPSASVLLTNRRFVHDHDFRAADMPSRWAGGKGTAWKDAGSDFQHEGKAAGVDWLTYRNLLRTDKPGQAKPGLVVDDLAYNNFKAGDIVIPTAPNWASDLMLEAHVTLAKADGELWYEIGRGRDRFQARFELTTSRCTIYRLTKGAKPIALASVKETALNKSGTYVIRFANFADRLTLWIDDQLPFGDGVSYEPALQKGPTLDDFEPIRIGSRGATVKVEHLQVWRNIYYTHLDGALGANRLDPTDPNAWEPLRKPRVGTFYVQPGHYFFMSDNPPAASDSRDWGVVPAQLLNGRVLFRYYPFERAGTIR